MQCESTWRSTKATAGFHGDCLLPKQIGKPWEQHAATHARANSRLRCGVLTIVWWHTSRPSGSGQGPPFSRQQTGAPHPKLVGPTPSSGWAQLLGYQSPTPTAPGASPGTPPGLQGQFTWQPAKWKCGASSSLEDGALKCSSSMSRKHH